MRSIKEHRELIDIYSEAAVPKIERTLTMFQLELLLDIKELLIEIETQMPFEPNGPR